ncbi:MAG: hypothetical protein QOD53_432 [Thermoleophilaceae bacterium]|jgi:uncharacterized membrane protein|nr:hypothetical protein [Thermoleophilaceae bacterium]
MDLAALTAYSVSLFVHIAAVVVGFGATFAESVMFPVAMKLDPRHLPYVHRLQLTINRFFATPALVVVLGTGIYQVQKGDWSFGDVWISATLAIVIVIGGLNGAYFVPADRRLGAMVEREIAAAGDGEVVLSEEYQRGARTEGIVGTVTGLLLLAAIFLMVVKPGA